jgi:hypothetical protein
MLIRPTMTFTPEGLVLGVGTVLLEMNGPRRPQSSRGQEVRLLALLSAFHSKPIAPSVLRNIERAAKAWNKGDDCLAYIHLAHTGLSQPQDLPSGAYRLEMAHRAVKQGASPHAVFKALHLDARYIAAVEKAYNPAEPRVPAGSGRTSGEWTDGASTAEDDSAGASGAGDEIERSSLLSMPLPASSFLGELSAAQVAELGAYGLRLLGPLGAAAAAFGLLFIPPPNDVHIEGEVPEIPGLRYSWNRDETLIHLSYGNSDGGQSTLAFKVDGELIHDEDGNVVGRIIGGNRIVIDTLAALPDLVKQDEPRLCPAAAPDVPGSDQGKPYEENKSRQYEDFVKLLINPPPSGPTLSGFVYYLPSSQDGDPVSYDDCKWTNGILFEIEGESYAKLTNDLPDIMTGDFVGQATRQLEANGGRPVVWIFAEERAALFARDLFDKIPGLERITVAYVPWIKGVR